jgi:type III secretory pathway component EscV
VVTDHEAGTQTPTAAESSRRGSAPLITDARMGTSEEMSSRIRRYTITMAFRAACFLSMIFVHGIFRWVLFACAVILPFIAVIAANQVNQHFGSGKKKMTHALPTERPELTTGHDDGSSDHEVVEEDGSQYRRNERVA